MFYSNGYEMMVVEINTEAGFAAGSPYLLFDQPHAHQPAAPARYNVASDGQRFLRVKEDETQSSQCELRVVLN